MKYVALVVTLVMCCASLANAQTQTLTGIYKTSFESGTVPAESTGKDCAPPLKILNDMCVEPYTATNTLGIFENKGIFNFAAELSFFNGHTCAVGGRASKTANGWYFQESKDGQTCRVILRQTADAITFTVPTGYDCSAYCGARGTLADASFPLSSKLKYTPANTDELKCITGEGACKWQNDKKADE